MGYDLDKIRINLSKNNCLGFVIGRNVQNIARKILYRLPSGQYSREPGGWAPVGQQEVHRVTSPHNLTS